MKTRVAVQLAPGRRGRAHGYDPDPLGTTQVPPCICGMTRAHRSHQPLWWRLLNRGVNWR